MKSARIYKDNFRENPLISLFIAETSPIILIGIAVGIVELVLFFLVFHITNFPFVFVTLGISEMGFFILTTGKKDNEMKYKAIPRRVGFSLAKKHYATKQLDKSISDFKIVGNYIERRKNLIAVYEIYPS